MLCRSRTYLSAALILAVMPMIGCQGMTPRFALQQSQLRAQQLYQQNKQLANERNGMAATANQLAADKAAMEQQLAAANSRLENLASSNSKLEDKMRTLLTSGGKNNPLSPDANRRFEDLRNKYKDFDFDPQTGVSKFSSDLLFASGSDELNPKANELLKEIAQILNQGDARDLKVLISGHTDDKPIKHESTAKKHRDNMGLSAHRALSVERGLEKAGLSGNRMGISGYGPYQPVEPNTNDKARQKNRRVEIYVLAPNTPMASAWDPELE